MEDGNIRFLNKLDSYKDTAEWRSVFAAWMMKVKNDDVLDLLRYCRFGEVKRVRLG
jgi:hypothetical protein